jgi:hypothetical protein
MSRRTNYFGLWERISQQRQFNIHLHYDMDPRDMAYLCNAMEDFAKLEEENTKLRRVADAARAYIGLPAHAPAGEQPADLQEALAALDDGRSDPPSRAKSNEGP